MEGEAAWRASPAMRCETRGSGYSPSLMQGGSACNGSGSSPFRVIRLPHGSACVNQRWGAVLARFHSLKNGGRLERCRLLDVIRALS